MLQAPEVISLDDFDELDREFPVVYEPDLEQVLRPKENQLAEEIA